MPPYMRIPRLLLGLSLALALLPPGAAQAAVVCELQGTTLAITLSSPIEPVRVVVVDETPDPDPIEVFVGTTVQLCGGPAATVDSTDLVSVADLSPGSSVFTIDLTGGRFEPGSPLDPEDLVDATPTPEIEFLVDLGFGSSDELVILGNGAPDHFVLGTDGINLNADDEEAAGASHDADVTTTSVEIHTIHANGGTDEIDGRGLGGTDPFPFRMQVYGGLGDDELYGGAVGDLLAGEDGADRLEGGDGDDELLGGPGTDMLEGGDGHDLLEGGEGDDDEDGGPGDDTFDQGADPDGGDVLIGGEGDLDLVAYDLRDGALTVTLDGAPGSGEAGEGDTVGADVEGALGGSGDDTLTGNASDNFLRGRAGNDVLRGVGGDDQLTGGNGDDVLDGGPGVDRASFFGAGPVQVDLGAGAAAGQGDDALLGIEDVQGGQFDDVLIGDDGPNLLSGRGGRDLLAGGDGNDVLEGGGGNDTLQGGAGDDRLDGGSEADLADFQDADGPVTADLVAGAASGRGDDVLIGIEHLRGGPFADTLVGDAGPNRLTGRRGHDRLVGGHGDDRFFGGKGNDRMLGGRGRDVFVEDAVANGRDVIDGGPGKDLVTYARRVRPVRATLGGPGGERGERDRIRASVEDLRGGKANDVLIGSGKPNRILGGPGDDLLRGRGRRDVLIGGAGDDRLDGGRGKDRCRGGKGRDRRTRCER